MPLSINKLKAKLETHLDKFKWGWALILVGVLGWLDYITGYVLRFAPIYLLPISFVTWAMGRRAGLVVSAASTTVWFISNIWAGLSLTPWQALWNIFIRQFSYSIFVFVLADLKMKTGQAHYDYLTEIYNKRLFHESANRELARCRRDRKPITIGYIDCDDFKKVNDRQGHEEGDRLLKCVAKTIQGELRATDIVARMGGDEFAILLPGTDSLASADVITKVRQQLNSVMEKNRYAMTFSVGIVTFRSSPDTVKDMLQKADRLMYSVKQTTKNRIEHEVVS
jgi:diguanylate cyclase (GGDEF)-like protein